jgi:hypothetical protein
LVTNRLQVASRTSFFMILDRSGSIFLDFGFFWVLFSAKYFSYLTKDVVVFRHPFLFLDSTFGEGNPERTRIRTGSDGIRNRCRILSESDSERLPFESSNWGLGSWGIFRRSLGVPGCSPGFPGSSPTKVITGGGVLWVGDVDTLWPTNGLLRMLNT